MTTLRVEDSPGELEDLYRLLLGEFGQEATVKRVPGRKAGDQGEPFTAAVLLSALAADLVVKMGEAIIGWFRKRKRRGEPRLVLIFDDGTQREVKPDDLIEALKSLPAS